MRTIAYIFASIILVGLPASVQSETICTSHGGVVTCIDTATGTTIRCITHGGVTTCH